MWDYIIVGAGSAGAVVANRLSADPDTSVLLIEAGGPADDMKFRVPALGALNVIGNPVCDWMFMTEADPTRNDRVDMWSRGKALGGSSIINGTIYVRGNRGDYDHWAALGNTGWDYASVRECFRRLENDSTGLSPSYGKGGPVYISKTRGAPKVAHTFLAAMEQMGVPGNADYNGDQQFGAAITHVSQKRGWRWSTARAYLDPARARPNLTVRTGVLAHRVVFDASRRAVGVELEQDGKVTVERCRREVVLSASVFNTPKLLMLSGIGDPAQLAQHGIALVHANPNVGQNLHEHPSVPIMANVSVRTSNVDMGWFMRSVHAARYALFRSGPAAYVFPAIAFAKLRPQERFPDVQFHFGAYGFEITEKGLQMLDKPTVTMLVNVSRTRSRGHVRLRSANPADPVAIQPNMLADRADVDLLKEGLQFGRRLLRTPAFSKIFVAEHVPGEGVASDDDVEAYVRQTASPCYHACGTARMGIDGAAVVDPRLRVLGVQGLRVIDCSIIPQVPSGNTNAISMLIGEKGAEMILEDNSRKES